MVPAGPGVAARPRFSGEKGVRIYAVGDIHGRTDLFARLMSRIAADAEARQPRPSLLVILGDMVDRGPDAAGLVRRLMRYTAQTDRVVVLKGNHEQMMVRALAGDVVAFGQWLRWGGEETLRSFGIEGGRLRSGSAYEMIKAARARVGEDVLTWLDHLPLSYRSGDVLFVHAGIQPGVPLEDQTEEDLLWIGDAFLKSRRLHPVRVVHGHTIYEDGPVMLDHRIGVDTGAYRTGRLSAVRLEDAEAQALST